MRRETMMNTKARVVLAVAIAQVLVIAAVVALPYACAPDKANVTQADSQQSRI